jgi:predicted dehydrogenase
MNKKTGVGLVGTGRRGYELAVCMANLQDKIDLEVRALNNRTPIRMEEAKVKIGEQYAKAGKVPEIKLYDNYEKLIHDPEVELVMINTPQYAHRDPALKALQAGKRVYVDKPLAHTLEDALAIYRAQSSTNNQVIVSFTRRFETPWIKTWDLVKDGIIGKIRMIQVRNVIPYHIYFHTWVRRREWSGGPLADKMSHIFDVFNWFSAGQPKKVSAFSGLSVFNPEKNPPERCSLCKRDCPYREITQEDNPRPDAMVDFDTSRLSESDILKRHDTCVWLPGADIDDHGLVSLEYDNGVKASLFWTLFGPDSEDQETLELVGDKGRIILTRHHGTIDIVTDYGKKHEVLDLRSDNSEGTHFGADDQFILALDAFCKGEQPTVTAADGLLASRMVEAAQRSSDQGGSLVMMNDVEDA